MVNQKRITKDLLILLKDLLILLLKTELGKGRSYFFLDLHNLFCSFIHFLLKGGEGGGIF